MGGRAVSETNAQEGKIKIPPRVPGGWHTDHFLPIIQFCLDNGCEFYPGLSKEKPFRVDQGGESHCIMYGPVTMADIINTFELPNTFDWDVSAVIKDTQNRTTLIIYSYEEKAQLVAKNRARQAAFEAKRAAIKGMDIKRGGGDDV